MEQKVLDVLATLPPREQEVLRLRAGLETGSSLTMEQVGLLYKVIREHIRLIEAKALRRLGHPCRSSLIGANQAIEDSTKVIELDPTNASAYSDRGRAYEMKGLYDLAIEDFTKAIELKPSTITYFWRGGTYKAKGQDDLANADFAEAFRIAKAKHQNNDSSE